MRSVRVHSVREPFSSRARSVAGVFGRGCVRSRCVRSVCSVEGVRHAFDVCVGGGRTDAWGGSRVNFYTPLD